MTDVNMKTIDAHVCEHYVYSDENSYEHIYYTIKVRIENLVYSVDRSYVDFVELDRRLRKLYPKSNFLNLPLDATDSLVKVLVSKDRENKRKSIGNNKEVLLTSARESIISSLDTVTTSLISQSSNPFRIREKYHENFALKINALDNYLVNLLSHHEFVASDEILLFLDEEASSLSIDLDSLKTLSEHDLLLINLPINKSTVRRCEEKSFDMLPGQIILWKFSTVDYDIGFSVEVNGETKVPYTRYKSHEKMICGTYEPNLPSYQKVSCVLKWDNSYARCKYS